MIYHYPLIVRISYDFNNLCRISFSTLFLFQLRYKYFDKMMMVCSRSVYRILFISRSNYFGCYREGRTFFKNFLPPTSLYFSTLRAFWDRNILIVISLGANAEEVAILIFRGIFLYAPKLYTGTVHASGL